MTKSNTDEHIPLCALKPSILVRPSLSESEPHLCNYLNLKL